MSEYDFKETEKKWQKAWNSISLFEPRDNDSKKSFFITVAWPYPSGAMHVGHARTYTVPDVIARFKRMKNFNVLFPMGYHLTGSPIIGAVERIRNGDEKYIRLLKDVYGVSDEDFSTLTDPVKFAKYFTGISELGYRKGMEALGYSIAWSRECTSIDPHFSRMIEWQYTKLKEQNLIVEGSHPVKFCPHDNNPVTDHDLLEGENAEITELTLVKYVLEGKEDVILPAATLRPETTCGITNIWLNPDVEYCLTSISGGEKWIVSREAVLLLEYQGKKPVVEESIMGNTLIGKKVINPFNNEKVFIFPATFVDPGFGSGVVGSVPGHAPYDYIALLDFQNDFETINKFGFPQEEVSQISPVKIIELPGFKMPAKDIVEKMGIKSQKDKEPLEAATKEIYREEFVKGKMIEVIRSIGGMKVSAAKEETKKLMQSENTASIMFDFSEKPVVCRCGTPCIVKLVENQWFLRYSDEEWKKRTAEHFKKMTLIPQETITYYLNTIDWLKEWPCTRSVGLGTKLPWDKRWIIESLSDSTIYMTYYTFSHLIKSIAAEKLNHEFFDFIFWKKGDKNQLAKAYDTSAKHLEDIQNAIHYWHPQDFRVSANELIPNHLTFFVYHHLAVLPENLWPSGIATFGMGILEGAKMASSKGNIFAVRKAVEIYGADVTRFYLMYMAEPWQDFDWRGALAEATRKQLLRFYNQCIQIIDMEDKESDINLDNWLISILQGHVREVNIALESFQTRRALQHAFYLLLQDIRWYLRRGGSNKKLLVETLKKQVQMLCPFIPHISEELWEMLGGTGLCSVSEFPEFSEDRVDEKAVMAEEFIKKVMDDISNIKKIVSPAEGAVINIVTAPEYKEKLLDIIIKNNMDMKDVSSEIKNHGMETIKDIFRDAGNLIKELKKMGEEDKKKLMAPLDEYNILYSAKGFLSEAMGMPVQIFSKGDFDDPKAMRAMPKKPSIIIK